MLNNPLEAEELRKRFSSAFTKIFQRLPKDDEELMAYVLATYFSGDSLRPLLSLCVTQAASVIAALQGPKELEKVMKSPMGESTSRCLNLFVNGILLFLELAEIARLEYEVKTALDKAMKLESDDGN